MNGRLKKGDMGGNFIKIDYVEGQKWNLHKIYDALFYKTDKHPDIPI